MRCQPIFVACVSTAAVACTAAAGLGQTGVAAPAADNVVPFEQFVPTSTRLFIAVHRLEELQAGLPASRAETLLPFIGALPEPGAALDTKSFLKTFLGPACRMEWADLHKTEFAVAARSWSQIADGVLFVRLPDESAPNRWFADSQQRSTRISRHARMLRVEGATLCIRDGILAASRAAGAETLMRETLRLMAGRGSSALKGSEEYRRLMAYLPAKPLATAFSGRIARVGPDPGEETEETEGIQEFHATEAAFGQGVLGVYRRDGRLEIALRANRAEPVDRPALDDAAMDRLRALPHTTIFAWAGSLETLGLSGLGDVSGPWAKYAQLLLGSDLSLEDASLPLGPHIILAWDQDLSGSGGTPQFAVLLRSDDARLISTKFSALADCVLERIHVVDPVDLDSVAGVKLTTRMGVPIASVALRGYCEASRFPGARLLRNLEPSWAASGDWWIFALTRDHLERILDAQSGSAPRLESLPDVRSVLDAERKCRSIVLARLEAAAGWTERWAAQAKSGQASLLNPKSWNGDLLLDVIQPDRLGIGMRSDQEPGVVVVARVDAETAADGVLQAGDRILGIDGQLLDLNSPNADLRNRWHRVRSATSRTVRIERDGAALDVELVFDRPDIRMPEVSTGAVAALVELARIGRDLPFVSFTELGVDAEHFAAIVSLQVAPAAGPVTATVAPKADSPGQ